MRFRSGATRCTGLRSTGSRLTWRYKEGISQAEPDGQADEVDEALNLVPAGARLAKGYE